MRKDKWIILVNKVNNMKNCLFIILFLAQFVAAQSTKEIRLLVRGDDMGSFASANQACIEAATKGIARSIEVMVPCAWFPEAARLLNENPSIDVGVHLILSSEWTNCKWRPLTCGKSIVDANGYFYPLIWTSKEAPGCSLQEAKWNIEDIEAEFRAQIETAKKNIHNVTHLSTHMICVEWNKELTALVHKLAKEYGLYWNPDSALENFPRMNVDKDATLEKRIDAFIEAFDKLEAGKTYLFIEHPAYNTPEMQTIMQKATDRIGKDREYIVKMFTDERVKSAIKAKGIHLVSYADIIRM